MNPTGSFTIIKPQDQEIGKFYFVQERRTTDLEAHQLWKGRLRSTEGALKWLGARVPDGYQWT